MRRITMVAVIVVALTVLHMPSARAQSGHQSIHAARANIESQSYYPEGYTDLKVAAARSRQRPEPFETSAAMAQADTVQEEAAAVNLSSFACQAPFSLTSTDPTERVLEYTAVNVDLLEGQLRVHQIDEEVFAEPLLAYERGMIALSRTAPERFDYRPGDAGWESVFRFVERQRALEDTLANDLRARQRQLHPDGPTLSYQAWCTAFATSAAPTYIIRTVPPNGRVWMVPAFRFYVCERRLPDPWDIEACRWWREYHPDQTSSPYGRHMFQARWPDGEVTRGDRTFEPSPSGATDVVEVRRN